MVCIMTVFETVLVVGGCMAGISQHGAVGAAIGSALGYRAAMAIEFFVTRTKAGLRVPLAQAALIVLASVVMALVIVLLPDNEATKGGAITHILLVVPVGGGVYLAAILALFPDIGRGLWRR